MRSAVFVILVVVCCIATYTHAQPPPTASQDCVALGRACDTCTRRLPRGRDEDIIVARLNTNCRSQVGARWRNLTRCQLTLIRCRTLNRPLSCARLAAEAGRGA